MPRGTEVGLGPGYIVLDGDPAPLKGAQPPHFSAHVQSSPVQSCPAKPSPASPVQSSPAQPSPAQPSPVQFISVHIVPLNEPLLTRSSGVRK